MLRLTVSTEEYLMIGDNIKVVFLGGTKNHLRIMVDAPKEINIVRSSTLEKQITDPEEKANLPKYYAEPENGSQVFKEEKIQSRNFSRQSGSVTSIIAGSFEYHKSGPVFEVRVSGYYKATKNYSQRN